MERADAPEPHYVCCSRSPTNAAGISPPCLPLAGPGPASPWVSSRTPGATLTMALRRQMAGGGWGRGQVRGGDTQPAVAQDARLPVNRLQPARCRRRAPRLANNEGLLQSSRPPAPRLGHAPAPESSPLCTLAEPGPPRRPASPMSPGLACGPEPSVRWGICTRAHAYTQCALTSGFESLKRSQIW